jgi:hypothetical protein
VSELSQARRPRTARFPLLNVSQLREQLERIERHGGGHWEIDLSPDEDDVLTTPSGQADVAFELCSYGITSATALGDGLDFVLLRFARAPQRPLHTAATPTDR